MAAPAQPNAADITVRNSVRRWLNVARILTHCHWLCSLARDFQDAGCQFSAKLDQQLWI